MLCVISPAKSLDFASAGPDVPRTVPVFAPDAARLARAAGRLSRARLKTLMELSDDLADLNWRRFKAFKADPARETTRQAGLAFAGDTYIGLDFASLDPASMAHAQENLRILSGLYGILRPFDAIQPYRLEMGRRLKAGRAENLYDYWGTRLAAALDVAAQEAGARAIVNLASAEYFRAARADALKTPVITPVFLDEKAGVARTVGFFAKRARGAMARFVMENQLADPDDLRAFDHNGYRFQGISHDGTTLTFLRAAAAAA